MISKLPLQRRQQQQQQGDYSNEWRRRIYKNQKILKGLAASVHLHKFQWKIKRIESVLKIKFGRSRTNRCVRT